jgi:hypothetical protein
MSEQVSINGVEVWALIREQDRGIRVRLSLDDWDRCRIGRGERIRLQRYQWPVELFFLAEHVEMPPCAWFNLETQVSLAG